MINYKIVNIQLLDKPHLGAFKAFLVAPNKIKLLTNIQDEQGWICRQKGETIMVLDREIISIDK